jgi:MFS family permease
VRGLGALFGPLGAARWAGHRESRLRMGILIGFLLVGLGYAMLGVAGTVWVACVWVILGHCGGSTVWVFSTTLLQLNTDDRFRGRVLSAELGICMLTLAIGAYVSGVLIDHGLDPRSLAVWVGLFMLIPAAVWGRAMQWWKVPAKVAAVDATD